MPTKYAAIAKRVMEAYRQSSHNDDEELLKFVADLLREPLEGLLLVAALVSETADDKELAYIAAGPFEDLFSRHYDVIFDALDEIVRTNIKMRRALTGVWVSEDTKCRTVLDRLLNKYQLTYGSL